MNFYRTVLARQILVIILFNVQIVWTPFTQAAEAVTVGGGFALTAPDGKTVTDQTYLGKWMLVYFGYTSCPDSCPTTLLVMAAVLRDFGSEATKLQAVFITVDPERDTPKVMGEYTQSFDPRIIGLTGTKREIDAVSQAYGAFSIRHNAGPDAGHYLVDHSTYIYLMNPRGEFVRAFDAEASSNTIASALRNVIAQSHAESKKRAAETEQ